MADHSLDSETLEAELDLRTEIDFSNDEDWNAMEQTPEVALKAQLDLSTIANLDVLVDEASIPVLTNTDLTYRKMFLHFTEWSKKKFPHIELSPGSDPFHQDIPRNIVLWIMELCDTIDVKGKPVKETPRSYSHAMKLRASLTYCFGRVLGCGAVPWEVKEDGTTKGNPSLSPAVSQYMVALRKRKHNAGDSHNQAQSTRAITTEILEKLFIYNRYEFSKQVVTPGRYWGGPNVRLMLQAAYNIAFLCLMRMDEVLTLKCEDIEVNPEDDNCLIITLRKRKTQQVGGIKSFYLWMQPNEEDYLCPIRALRAWLLASNISSGFIFRHVDSQDRVRSSGDTALSAATFRELFRNNLIDIKIDPTLYGGHSFRRGGCQYLALVRRWPLLQLCDWGGWAGDISNSTITRYLYNEDGWSFNPRNQYLNPNRPPLKKCHACGRSCHCG